MKDTKVRTIKVRLYPNKQQNKQIVNSMSHVRFVWNKLNEELIDHFEKTKTLIRRNDLVKKVTPLKRENLFLYDTDTHALQHVAFRLHRAFKEYSRKKRKQPRFKSKKYRGRQSYDMPDRTKIIDLKHIKLAKLGKVKVGKIRNDLNIVKLLTSQVILEPDGKTWLAIVVNTDTKKSVKNFLDLIGIDVGSRFLVSDDQGDQIRPLDLTNELKHKKYLQRRLDRQTKDSKRSAITKQRLTSIERKMANKRKDFLHKLTTSYAQIYENVIVEDLNIKKMTKNTKGTKKNPNRDSKRDSRRNGKMLRQGWYNTFLMFEYKLKERGGRLIKVDPAYTSQTCFVCGTIDKRSRDKESYKCVHCGHEDHADINAAKNIKAKGFKILYPQAA